MADAIAEKYNTTKSQVLDHVRKPLLTSVFPQKKAFCAFTCVILSISGVKGKCCCEDGFGRNTNCPGDPTIPIREQRLLGFFQPGA